MKSNILKIFFIAVAVMFCFSGCSSDENDKNQSFEEIRRFIASGNYDEAKKALDSVDEGLINDEYHMLYADYYQDKTMGDDSRAFEKRDFNAAAEYLYSVYKETPLSEISNDVRDRFNRLLYAESLSEENKNKIKIILGYRIGVTNNSSIE